MLENASFRILNCNEKGNVGLSLRATAAFFLKSRWFSYFALITKEVKLSLGNARTNLLLLLPSSSSSPLVPVVLVLPQRVRVPEVVRQGLKGGALPGVLVPAALHYLRSHKFKQGSLWFAARL